MSRYHHLDIDDPGDHRPSRAEAEFDARDDPRGWYLIRVTVDGEDLELDVEVTSCPTPATRDDPGDPWEWEAVHDAETGKPVEVDGQLIADALDDALEGWR